MILRNHGLLVVGPTIPEAFNRGYWLEMACKAQVDAMSMSNRLILPAEELRHISARTFHPEGRLVGHTAWPAMLRLLEARGALSYAS